MHFENAFRSWIGSSGDGTYRLCSSRPVIPRFESWSPKLAPVERGNSCPAPARPFEKERSGWCNGQHAFDDGILQRAHRDTRHDASGTLPLSFLVALRFKAKHAHTQYAQIMPFLTALTFWTLGRVPVFHRMSASHRARTLAASLKYRVFLLGAVSCID